MCSSVCSGTSVRFHLKELYILKMVEPVRGFKLLLKNMYA